MKALTRYAPMMALLPLLAVALGACSEAWVALPEEARPTEGETLADGLVHVVTPRGLDRLAAAAWDQLAVRYGDGLAAAIEQRPVQHEETALAVYGPGRIDARPEGVTFERDDEVVVATMLLGDARATIPVRTWRSSGQELACTVKVTLVGARYRFPLTTVPDGNGAVRVVTKTAGVLVDDEATVAAEECAFALTEEHEQTAVGRARASLWAALDHEWMGDLGDAARDALDARLGVAALLPVPSAAGSEATGRLSLLSSASRALEPAGDGLATWYSVGLAASGPACDVAETALAPLEGELVLPRRTVAPDGAPYDEALVVTRPLLARALDAGQRAGLLSGRLPAAGAEESGAAAALAALWPAETPAEVARLRSDRFSVRLRLAAEEGAGAPVFEVQATPNAGGTPWAPLRVRVGRLRVSVYGALEDLDLRLFTLEASGVTLDLVPETDGDGLLRLRVTALQTERLESQRGLLSLPTPGAAWIELLLDAALAEQPILDLGALASPIPILAGTEWLEGDSFVIYLRRPDATRSP